MSNQCLMCFTRDGHADGCERGEVERLTRERDEARAVAKRMAEALRDEACTECGQEREIEALTAALRQCIYALEWADKHWTAPRTERGEGVSMMRAALVFARARLEDDK